MRYFGLACDYDGTLAHHGRVADNVIEALERFRNTGRQLILVTGRELEHLQEIFPRLDLFARVVAENGALLYRPETNDHKLLCEPPPPAFVQALKDRAVSPLSVGHGIVALWDPYQKEALDAIQEQGLELHVIFNKGAVMVLPSGVNKAFGLKAAADELNLSLHNIVGVGDAENDHAFLDVCECGVAVASALDALKEKVDLVTRADHGDGVIELIERVLDNELRDVPLRVERNRIRLGERENGEPIFVPPHGKTILLTGASGSGKSTLATSFLESLIEFGYQFCIIDPEGDYEGLNHAIALGDPKNPPEPKAVGKLLENPAQNGVLNLLAIPMDDRPERFNDLISTMLDVRAHHGRPHWIVIDEAHHVMPPEWQPRAHTAPEHLHGVLLITVHPDHVSRPVLRQVDYVVVVGEHPEKAIERFAVAAQRPVPKETMRPTRPGEAVFWDVREGASPEIFRSDEPMAARKRHKRKYAEGDLSPEISFYFRGPRKTLNLRAQNLQMFIQLAEGVDDDTWNYHLHEGGYSDWFRTVVKDEGLADAVAAIERDKKLSPAQSRERIRDEIQQRYTGAA